MINREWIRPALRRGVEARLDDPNGDTLVVVSLTEDGAVQWQRPGGSPPSDGGQHSFHFWVQRSTDSQRLHAIQLLGTSLSAAGHRYELTPVRAGR